MITLELFINNQTAICEILYNLYKAFACLIYILSHHRQGQLKLHFYLILPGISFFYVLGMTKFHFSSTKIKMSVSENKVSGLLKCQLRSILNHHSKGRSHFWEHLKDEFTSEALVTHFTNNFNSSRRADQVPQMKCQSQSHNALEF